jgi:hypothetical protein
MTHSFPYIFHLTSEHVFNELKESRDVVFPLGSIDGVGMTTETGRKGKEGERIDEHWKREREREEDRAGHTNDLSRGISSSSHAPRKRRVRVCRDRAI